MTTNAECTAAAQIVTTAAGWATLAAYGGGGAVQNADQRLFVTDGFLTGVRNTTPQLGASLTAAAAALTAIGQGGSHSANSSSAYSGWAASVLQAMSMSEAAGDAISTQRLATALQVLNNLAAGV